MIITAGFSIPQPHAVSSTSGGVNATFEYDLQGNMFKRIQTGVTYDQGFDKENRLTSVTNNGHPFPAFPNVEEEVNLNNQDYTLKYTYSSAGVAVGVRTKAKQGASTTNTLHYLYSDHLGSTSTVTNASGGQVQQTRFLPFGGYWGTPTQTVTDRGYTGHLHNDEVGLIYMNARFYVPAVGRFASADTIVPTPTNPQAFNRYSYVKNNPLNRVDPTGHVDCAMLGDESDSAGCEEAKLKPKPEEQIASTSRTLAEWELHALMQAIYSETVNGSYSPELLEFLAWGYLNRLSSGKWANMGDAVYSEAPIGYTPDGIPIFPGSPQSSAGVLWAEVRDKWTKKDVPQLVEERWAINANSNWQTVEEIVNLVYQDWLQNGAGSANDPTNGSYFYAAFSELNENNNGISLTEFESLVADKANSFQSLQNEDPNFRWGKTSVYSTSRSYIVFFAANSHCGYNLNCGE